tara:strand:+ start:4676 stop:5845 length:1170 start_codon:yes stop_codon:yes gene_type:complete
MAMQRNTDTVPAMLTPGEFVVRKEAVDEIGTDKLNLVNNIDRLSQLSSLMEYRPSGYQEGGEVMNYYGGGKVRGYQDGGKVVSETLDVFGDKSSAADSLNALISIRKMQPEEKQEQERQRLNKLGEEGNRQIGMDGMRFRGGIDEALPDGMTELELISSMMAKNRNQGIISDFPYLPLDDVMHKYDISEYELPFYLDSFESTYGDKDDLDKEQQGFLDRVIEHRLTLHRDKVMGERPMRPVTRESLGDAIEMGFQQGGMVPGMMPPQMPAQSLPPAGMMMQEGGMVDQPMPQGEPMGMDLPPMPTGERAFPASSPMEQLGLKPNEMMAYEQYGPDTFRYMATKFKPESEFTMYDSVVSNGLIDPYETSENDFASMVTGVSNNLRGMNGV